MATTSQQEKRTSFYLHSDKNRRSYPSTKYPLTHLIDYQGIENRRSKQPTYVKHFKYTFLLLLLFIICTTFFQLHIYVYNSFFGPFHFNLDQFIKHVKDYQVGQSWFKRIEYIQIELGQNNIQEPIDTYHTIRRYSNPRTRQDHIATYKKVKKPSIYVKLPTRSQTHFHTRFPFQFSSYSIKTLQCIAKNLQAKSETTYNTWFEKSEYVKYINDEYAKNSTRFNMLVLTKCGICIGYLYRPQYEMAFIPTREHTFSENDVALDVTRPYHSFYTLLISSLIFLWLFCKAAFYLMIYLSNIIRFKFGNKYGILSFPLVLSPNVLEELWILNIDEEPPHEQLLQLDEFIQRSQHKFNNQLFIIEDNFQHLFVVLLEIKLYEKATIENNSSPFIICPVTDIRNIVQYRGICYGDELSWIPCPSTMTQEQNYCEWLHEELMEISEHYKEQYEDRLQHEQGSEYPPSPDSPNPYTLNHRRPRRQRETRRIETPYESELNRLIRVEEILQRKALERQTLQERIERIFDRTTAASPRFIAGFQMEHKRQQNLIDSTMEDKNQTCMICLEDFKLNKEYARWPCPTQIPHIFHYECMLKTLRKKNTCPMCRHAVEANQTPDYGLYQLFTNLVL